MAQCFGGNWTGWKQQTAIGFLVEAIFFVDQIIFPVCSGLIEGDLMIKLRTCVEYRADYSIAL